MAPLLRLACALAAPGLVAAIHLDQSSTSSVESALSTIAYDLLRLYKGNETGQTPGLLPSTSANGNKYYWWEAGGMFGTVIDYWYYTSDSTYNDEVIQGIEWQVGSGNDFQPANQSSSLGNDDQAFWALTAMSAAEYDFHSPSKGQPGWLELAENVFNAQVQRWDAKTCGGGLRWQLFAFSAGYNYKNSESNGAFMQLAARLAKYTGNQTYADWASKSFDWMEAVGLIDSKTWMVADGTLPTGNCSDIDKFYWSLNPALVVYGSAVMWNITQSSTWKERTQNLISAMHVFFPKNIMDEVTCTSGGTCNNDQQSYKAYTARFLAATAVVAPWTAQQVQTWLSASAAAAAKTCTGGPSGTQCGFDWTKSAYDGLTGVGEEMAALEVIGAQLMLKKGGPLSMKQSGTTTGGTTTKSSSTTATGMPASTGTATATTGSSAPSSTTSNTASAGTGAAAANPVPAAMLSLSGAFLAAWGMM